ncbi:MAG: hypothetical protein ACTHOK_05115 [Nocardioidaceae bacterium]
MKLAEPAWLLRVARTQAADPPLRTAALFAAGGGDFKAVHRSQVTRWERGEIAATYAVVRRYEALCGLEEGRLTAAFDLVHRYDKPVAARPTLRRPMPPDPGARADELVALALSDAPLTGLEWDQLSALLGEMPEAFLRGADWEALFRRGLREMDVTVGLGYRQRAEAMNRLAGHPRAGSHLAAFAAALLTDPASQVYSEAAALLRYCEHPAAAQLLLDVVADPVNPNALRAALSAAATTVRARRTPHATAVELVKLALELTRDTEQPYRVRRAAADVLVALRPSTRTSIAHELRRQPTELSVASIVAGDGPRPREQLRELRARIARRLDQHLDIALHDEPTLLRLLGYITTETNDELRGYALHLLMLLPFGPAVGRAFHGELTDAVRRGDALGVHEALGVLLCLAPRDGLGLLTDLAARSVAAPGDRDQVAVEACWALGNAKFAAAKDTDTGARLAAAVSASWSRPPSRQLVEAWAYALAMSGHRDVLAGLVAPPDAPAAAVWERARQWWLDVPAHLLEHGDRLGP